ncbi:MAG: ABC transporter ATP-binding protein [Candidatus Micrarchaeota archaeon]|nr:MAG: ABC transporter ATP-binding protein [Candidatus Micrarchaeota archaeon]
MILSIRDLYVNVEGKRVLENINLDVDKGEIIAVMGPNGSGKSSLAKTITGHPKYKIERGDIIFDNIKINDKAPDERAKMGIFMQFQDPPHIEGINLTTFMKNVVESRGSTTDIMTLINSMKEISSKLGLPRDATSRAVNFGLSGGEKKKSEILQLALVKPKLAILDEPDSGLDVDSLKIVAEYLDQIHKETNMSMIIITHYSRIFKYIKPDSVHVLLNGKFVMEGDSTIIEKIEREGYSSIKV